MLELMAIAAAVVWCLIPPYGGKLDEYSTSSKIRDRHGHIMRIVLDKNDMLSDPIQQKQSGDWATKALIAGEDKRFLKHGGVDIIAVCRAVRSNFKSRRIVSGASTLSMLVGKLTEPRPRGLWTKIVQARHALYIEEQLDKDEILEQYLNRAPFGGNIVGIEAAARRYFAKSTADLTLSEAALLVGLPQSPSRLRPDRHFGRAINRRNYVLEEMRAGGFATDDQISTALAQEISVVKRPSPFLAPHFCDLVTRMRPHEPSITTSLDLDLQSLAEDALRARLEELKDQGISGGAIVVLDVKTGTIRAMVGSPDYTSTRDSGQVNCAISRRSPGSALKPFIYAMALDEGMCSPETIVTDAPVNFAGYKPSNFNGDYCGPVSVRHALVKSLNIPALLYVQKLGLEHVVLRLRSLGLSTLNESAAHYGLSIAIGTCEATLLDLVNAYACIARKGVYSDAAFMERPAVSTKTRLFSEEAAYMITDMLSGEERAYDADGHVADVRLPRIAWKTGTSAGNRDAWCIAYNPEYVVGVWIGNPSGKASPALIGCTAATPVATGLFRRFYPKGDAPWFDRPSGLKSRLVCGTSGFAPNDYCPPAVAADFIPSITATGECPVHRNVPEDEKRGEVYAVGHQTAQVLEHSDPDQTPLPAKRRLQIMSPAANATFHLVEDMPLLKQEISLASNADHTIGKFYWFVDGELYRTTLPGEYASWPLRNGRHVIACCDASGSGDSVAITVE
jgi:penicillin-binding protein 1C